jgi:mRNA interferase RelE/StbE
MTYNLEFKESALKEWRKLDSSIREQFKKKLAERIENPRIESSKLSGMPDCYKIKLKSAGYRLVYQVGYLDKIKWPNFENVPYLRYGQNRHSNQMERLVANPG